MSMEQLLKAADELAESAEEWSSGYPLDCSGFLDAVAAIDVFTKSRAYLDLRKQDTR